jgi:hypothetical protein
MDINKIISIVRNLKEEGVVSGAPTMSLGSGKIAGTHESGDDPPVFKKRKTYAKGGQGSRKWWLQYLKQK